MTHTYRLAPLSELREDPKNARKHGPANRSAVRSSLMEFGQVETLVVQKSTGIVLGGNCRLQELRDLGKTEAWICEVDVDGPKAKRLALILNRSGQLASWDTIALADVIRDLDAGGADLGGLGWEGDDLERLLGRMAAKAGAPSRIIDPDADPPAEVVLTIRCPSAAIAEAVTAESKARGCKVSRPAAA